MVDTNGTSPVEAEVDDATWLRALANALGKVKVRPKNSTAYAAVVAVAGTREFQAKAARLRAIADRLSPRAGG